MEQSGNVISQSCWSSSCPMASSKNLNFNRFCYCFSRFINVFRSQSGLQCRSWISVSRTTSGSESGGDNEDDASLVVEEVIVVGESEG